MKSTSSKLQRQEKVSAKKNAASAKKRGVVKKDAPRGKVVGGKVVFKPGLYTAAELEAALKALEDTE